MDKTKRSRDNSGSPLKNCSDTNLRKKLCKSPLKVKKVGHDSLNDYELMFAQDDSFDIPPEYFNKENNLNTTNSPVKLENNTDIPKKLDLSTWQRCRITNCQRDEKNYDQIVELRNDKTSEETTCRFQGPWSHTKVEVNEIVSISANWCSNIKCYVINKDVGFVVTNPDFLISTTSVVGSLFCRRKSVLQDKFRGIDADNKIMVIGSIVHELFQKVLTKKLKTIKQIEKLAQELLESQDIMIMLYSSKLNLVEAELEIQKFIPNIVNFVDQYMYGNKKNYVEKDIFEEKIDRIQDIEENVWVPQFGLKGKIDVSVTIHSKNKLYTIPKLMPLELKTGKPSFSMEHKGQVILYQMMLTEIGRKIDSGLLLYLRDGIMKEIRSTRNEQRDLILLRNDLAYYLYQNINPMEEPQGYEKDTKFQMLLPEPINHHNACSKCPYNTICTSFLLNDKNMKLSGNHPLEKISKDCTAHLNSKDLEYFIFWCGILSLEEYEIKKSNNLCSMLWIESSEERRKRGRAIINLKINGTVDLNSGKYVHNFVADEAAQLNQTEKQLDFTMTGISLGEYVIVSSLARIAIAAGHVLDIQTSVIKLSLERNLLHNYSNDNFIIDKYDSQSGMIFNYTNLGMLLENTEIAKGLRAIIIDNKPPTFTEKLPKIILREGERILLNLNAIQRSAVMKALSTNDYMLIKGLPGTGKTQTLVAIILLYQMIGKSVLITSHTHSAVDNLLIRLKSHKLKFLRLGAESRINPELAEYSEKVAISNCKDPDDLAKIYSSYQIVGVTCLGSSHSIFTHRRFDICIVDEATQVYLPTIFRPLYFSSKFILVGDPDQLPPLVRSKDAKKLGADQSLFHRLDKPSATSVLTNQYRMNKTITKLANDLTYGGKLICADQKVSSQCLKFPKQDNLIEKYSKEKWILRSLEKHIDQSVILIDTQNCFDQNIEFATKNQTDPSKIFEQTLENEKDNRRFKYINYCDASIVFTLVKAFLIAGYSAEEIGIIAPYRAQVELLNKLAHDCGKFYTDVKFDGLEVNTVDQYQGRDKKVILYSCTKTGNTELYQLESSSDMRSKENEILEDRRRLTVAITRSKHKLIIIGDEKCLVQYSPFRDLCSKIPGRCKIVLDDGKLGFSWKKNLNLIKDVMT